MTKHGVLPAWQVILVNEPWTDVKSSTGYLHFIVFLLLIGITLFNDLKIIKNILIIIYTVSIRWDAFLLLSRDMLNFSKSELQLIGYVEIGMLNQS